MKKFAVISFLAILMLSACKNTEEISDPAHTETADFETMTAENTEQPETADNPTEEAETESAAFPDDIEDWRRAYVEYLNDCPYIGGGVLLDDINFDGTPEAVISVNSLGFTTVLYYNENGLQVLELDVVSMWGGVRYDPETGKIFQERFYGHTQGTYGCEECYIYDWNGSEYEQSLSLLRESGYYFSEETAELGQAYINGEAVSNDAFDKKCSEFFAQMFEHGYFPVVRASDENFGEYMRENFPGFNNRDCIIPG